MGDYVWHTYVKKLYVFKVVSDSKGGLHSKYLSINQYNGSPSDFFNVWERNIDNGNCLLLCNKKDIPIDQLENLEKMLASYEAGEVQYAIDILASYGKAKT